MIKLIILSMCLFPSLVFGGVEKKSFDGKNLKQLVVKNSVGDLRIVGTDNEIVYVTVNKIKFDKGCDLKMNRVAEKLDIEVDGNSCEVNFLIQVPRTVSLYINSVSGAANVNGTKGKIEFNLVSGDIDIEAEVEELDGNTASGNIKIKGLLGDTKVNTASGNVTLTYANVIKKGLLDVETASGDTTIYFPKNMTILTAYSSGSGRIYNELGDSSDSTFKVSVKSGSGDLNIKKLK